MKNRIEKKIICENMKMCVAIAKERIYIYYGDDKKKERKCRCWEKEKRHKNVALNAKNVTFDEKLK